ncbi:MAG: site-2 protease family protein [Anaerolineae bacterium]
MRKQLELGKLVGVPLRVDPSWLLIFVWATWSLSTSYVPQRLPASATLTHWLVGAATSLLFFLSVLLHELGHALVARAQGEPVRRITLFIFGGAAEIGAEPATAKKELALAVAGPAVSLVLGVLWFGIGRITLGLPWLATIALYLGGANLALGLFNLVPGFPLDGGRVLRALIWQRTGSLQTATDWAARVGSAIALRPDGLGHSALVAWQPGRWPLAAAGGHLSRHLGPQRPRPHGPRPYAGRLHRGRCHDARLPQRASAAHARPVRRPLPAP